MKDQVGALVQAGVAAAFLNNSLTDNQKALMLHRAREHINYLSLNLHMLVT